MTTDATPMSLRAYASRRGVSAEAVSKAITAGRLRQSVVMVDGIPKIGDPDIADREWEINTRPQADRARSTPMPDGVPDYNVSRALREAAAARRETALADLAEIEVAEKHKELIPVEEAKRDVMAKFATVRTRILGVPTRLAQRMPALASQAVPLLEEFLREALEDLADVDDADLAE